MVGELISQKYEECWSDLSAESQVIITLETFERLTLSLVRSNRGVPPKLQLFHGRHNEGCADAPQWPGECS